MIFVKWILYSAIPGAFKTCAAFPIFPTD
jgi:hypothetical protein